MSIIDRFLALNLPKDQVVVIGSGVLDALGLRPSNDIDLVVGPALFAKLQASGEWRAEVRHAETVLLRDDVEVWQSWANDGTPNFSELYAAGMTIGGVRFANPRTVIEWKRLAAREKDITDIHLLERYLAE